MPRFAAAVPRMPRSAHARPRPARRRHARRRRRERASRARSPSSIATAACCTRPATRRSLTFTRSALKPLQALPFVARRRRSSASASASAQVALLCASHSGEPRHVDGGRRHARASAGNAPDDLQCGTHAPGFYDVRGEVPPPPPYSPLAHNCSGKHSGHARLLRAVRLRASTTTSPSTIRCSRRSARAVAAFTGVPEDELARRHRRLLGAELRDAARRPRAAPSPGSRAADDDAALRPCAAQLGRRDDRASGNGLGRAAQRPRAARRPAAATGSPRSAPKACRRSACAAGAWGIAIKVADGSKRGPAPGGRSPSSSSSGLLDDAAPRRAGRDAASPRCANYRGIADRATSGRSLSWTRPDGVRRKLAIIRVIPA